MFELLANDSIQIIFSYFPKSSLFPLCCVNNAFNNYLKLYIQNRKTTIVDLISIKWLNISTIVILSKHNPIIERTVGSMYTLSLPSTYLGESVKYYITVEDGTQQYIEYNSQDESFYSIHPTINLLEIPKIIFENAIGMYYQFQFNIPFKKVLNRNRRFNRQLTADKFSKKWKKRDIINTGDHDRYIIGYYDSDHLVFKTDQCTSIVKGIITKRRDIIKDLKNIREIIQIGETPTAPLFFQTGFELT